MQAFWPRGRMRQFSSWPWQMARRWAFIPCSYRLNYSRLSQVTASGGESTPNLVFTYEKASLELPLQAKVALGPKIELEGLGGETLPGAESSLRIVLTNQGDESALDLQIQARPSAPFLMVENGQERASIAPGESAMQSLSVFTDKNAHLATMPYPA